MNLGVITKPNAKGQIVIPKKYRDELGIDQDILLNISLQGKGVYITPIKETTSSEESKKLFMAVLKKTAGSWSGDDWQRTEKIRKRVELSASKKRKRLW